MGNYIVAIDAGTGSVRAVLFDTLGNQIAIGQREWFHLSEENIPNSMGFDTQKNWELILVCIKEMLDKSTIDPKDIIAFSATSMREGIIVYDAEGNELWGVANVDARAAKEVQILNHTIPKLEEELYQQSGQTFALGAIPRLLWLKNHHPDLYTKIASISMISDWVLYKLGGIIATDPSNGGTSGIFDLERRDWAPQMMEQVGLRSDIFPPCYESGTVIGNLSPSVSKATGCSLSALIVTGGGDVQLGSVGLGIVKPNQVAILGGSFWQQIVNIPSSIKPPKNMELRINPHVIDGLNQAEGITFFSGLVMRWFRDAFCEIDTQVATKQGIDTYTYLEQKARDIPVGSYGITPIFSDSMKYGKWYHASPSFIGLGIDTARYNRYSIFKALQENACIVSAINLRKIEAFSGTHFDTITFAGGASKGELWCQTLADVTGCMIKIPKVREATALGACMSACVGAGIFDSLESAADTFVVWEKQYTPNHDNHLAYQSIIKRWETIYCEQLKLVDRGLTESMWKAPGL